MKNWRGIERFCAATGFILLIVVRAVSADIALKAGESCATASCHTNLLESAGPHEGGGIVFESCDVCHVADEPGRHEFRYAATGGELCNSCHAGLTQHEFKHAPANVGLCSFCHSAHESQYTGRLNFPPEALCVSCHDKFVPEGVRTVHGPVEQGRCVACHDPHSSGYDDFLTADVPELCFGCHNEDQTDHEGRTLPAVQQTFVDQSLNQHPPFARGDCLLCHDPHASDNYRLQLRSYSEAFYTGFSTDSYFCLMCHGDATFTDPRTLVATRFRNGNLNLHYRHVNREKGRGCRACHHQHASGLDAQIATDTYFGEQNIGIKVFSKTDTGGSCGPSCHRHVKYDRLSPIDNLMMVTPREGVDATPSELRQALHEQDGKSLYLQRCAGCHGADAEGKIGPPIRGVTMDQVMKATERVDLMADLASLSPADLDAIVDSLPAGLPVVAIPEGASDGMILFSTNCAGCHGADANGGIAPAIRGATRADIRHAIGEVTMMVAMKSLGDQSIDAIGGYLLGLGDGATASSDSASVGVIEGEMVYSIYCIGCHAADARGQIGPSIRGMSESNIKDAIGRVSMMAGLKDLDSVSIAAVSSYLIGLDTKDSVIVADLQPDGKTLYATSCSACHGEDASGHIGPDIRGRAADDIGAAIDRVPMMAGVRSMTVQQIGAVGEYIGSLAVASVEQTMPGLPDGKAVFNMNCAGCHGADARGLIGPDITHASVEDITTAIESVPIMIAMKVLGARDISATADYLVEIREPDPAEAQQ